MTWIELKVNGMLVRIDSVNPLLIQRWREYVTKPDDWEECKIYTECGKSYINTGGKRADMARVVYKAHNPNWKDHYSRHNIIIFKDGNKGDYSIENLQIKDTGGVRRY